MVNMAWNNEIKINFNGNKVLIDVYPHAIVIAKFISAYNQVKNYYSQVHVIQFKCITKEKQVCV